MSFPVWSSDVRETVTEVLARAVARYPDNIFLDFQGETYTYADVDRRSTRLAHGLLSRGVKRGDRVCSLLDSNIDSISLWFAANKIGAVHVPVNTAYKGGFLSHQFDDAGAQLLVMEPDYALRLTDIEEDLPQANRVLVRGEDEALPLFKRIETERLSAAYEENDAPIPDENKPGDLCMLIFTGGTTGPSKGCMISHNYCCNVGRQILKREARNEKTVNWTPLPFFHMNALGGSILSSAMVGARVAVFPRFSVSRFWDDIERSGATIVNLLGSMLTFIANAPENEAAKRCFGQIFAVRGSPFPPDIQRKWRERFGVTITGSHNYGLTEAARVTTLADHEEGPVGNAGKINEDFDVRIVDDEDNEVPVGQPGEIIIRPRHPDIMFMGYWNRPEDTLKIMRNMWLHSGDIGRMDENGFMFFVDRKKDYLRRRGENISSQELEATFKKHKLVKDVAVHAVLAETEDEVKATITLQDGASITEEELCEWCVDKMPYFAVPRFFEFREDLPRNPVGRVLKYQLRDEGCTAATWDREKSGFELKKR
ncbi:AMP-binding protein [Sphingopyxis panaciterrulae]|uniref:Crotonobetaine/carnitine-CoA ligase n=1 Tax=Sphingopyxis panaciterrulae TaxID=462372 RepID=A0A7W9ERD9_9SPHN|nr:AMP-binding protein [Sphingopyxis panaciterrulae]MBB5707459.1 crotonobetaine/carnitine-CoA ligase [Sphingopyxis panaciterrulae]